MYWKPHFTIIFYSIISFAFVVSFLYSTNRLRVLLKINRMCLLRLHNVSDQLGKLPFRKQYNSVEFLPPWSNVQRSALLLVSSKINNLFLIALLFGVHYQIFKRLSAIKKTYCKILLTFYRFVNVKGMPLNKLFALFKPSPKVPKSSL